MARQTMDETLEKELSQYSYAAARMHLEGMKLQNQGNFQAACKNYQGAYQLSNATYRVLKGELSVLEMKAIGKVYGVKEE